MASRVSAAFYVALIFGLAAIGLHTVGYTMPGWLIISRKFSIEEIQVRSTIVIHEALRIVDVEIEEDVDDEDMIDEGDRQPSMDYADGMMMPRERPEDDSHDDDRMMGGMPHHDSHDRDGHHGMQDHDSNSMDGDGHHKRKEEVEMIVEVTEIQEIIQMKVEEVGHAYVKIMYGLWKSKICISSKMNDDEEEEMGEKDDSSSSESGKKKRCHCRRISTKCALAFGSMYFDMQDIEAKDMRPWYKPNTKTFLGNTCLTEHRVESTAGLVLLVIAVVAGVMFFRKQDSCKCWAVTCILGFITAVILVSIPAFRVLRHNYHHVRDHMTGSRLHVPFSLITTLVSALLASILIIVVTVAMITRKRRPRSWARFENEPATDEKNGGMPPSLVFIPEPLTGKAGLYDVWGDVKPVEYVEPEKKPLE